MAGRPRKYDTGLINKRLDIGTKRGSYNVKKIESRGKVKAENKVISRFWRDYTMDQVLSMSEEELDKAIDKHIDEFAARRLAIDPHWNFPEKINR